MGHSSYLHPVRLSYRQRLITLLVICIPRADNTTATIKPQKGNRAHFSQHAQAGWGPTRGLRFLFLYLTPGRWPKHPQDKTLKLCSTVT